MTEPRMTVHFSLVFQSQPETNPVSWITLLRVVVSARASKRVCVGVQEDRREEQPKRDLWSSLWLDKWPDGLFRVVWLFPGALLPIPQKNFLSVPPDANWSRTSHLRRIQCSKGGTRGIPMEMELVDLYCPSVDPRISIIFGGCTLLNTAREITRYAERAPSFPLLQQASTNPRYH